MRSARTAWPARHRLVLGIGACLALLAVVAAAAATASPPPGPSAGAPLVDAEAGAAVADLLVIATLGLGIFVSVSLMGALRPKRADEDGDEDEAGDPTQDGLDVTVPRWLQRTLVAAIVGGLLFAFVLFLTSVVAPSDSPVTSFSQDPSTETTVAPSSVAQRSRRDNEVGLALVVSFFLLAAAAGVGVTVRMRRQERVDDRADAVSDGPAPDAAADTALVPIDPFIVDFEALRAREPRRSVIESFAIAAAMLRAVGFGPRWDETSAEHVARVASDLPAQCAAHVRALLGLYYEARFSEHPLDLADRDQALRELLSTRDALVVLPRHIEAQAVPV